MDIVNPVQLALKRFGTQAELAKALGIAKQTVSAWNSGRNKVDPAFVLKFEQITGVPRWMVRPDIYPPKDEA